MNISFRKFACNFVFMFFTAIILFFAVDYFISHFYRQILADKFGESGLIRTTSLYYHHDLIPSQNLELLWGDGRYTLCTNDFGFKSSCTNLRSIKDKKYDVGFIGDSFVEGVGLDYEKTFTGLFAINNPDLSVANLGVSSYSPSTIFKKIEYLLSQGFKFDELVVFIDISDIQDEGLHVVISDGIILEKKPQGFLSPDNYWGMLYSHIRAQIKKNLVLTFNLDVIYQSLLKSFAGVKFDVAMDTEPQESRAKIPPFRFGLGEYYRSEWTYNQNSKQYGEGGVSAAIQQALESMNRLHLLLAKHDTGLTVVVYPWPMQLMSGDRNNLSVTIWRDFCINKCKKFIDINPTFFNELDAHSLEYVFNKYYLKSKIQNDIHFNENGNKLIYDVLKKNIMSH